MRKVTEGSLIQPLILLTIKGVELPPLWKWVYNSEEKWCKLNFKNVKHSPRIGWVKRAGHCFFLQAVSENDLHQVKSFLTFKVNHILNLSILSRSATNQTSLDNQPCALLALQLFGCKMNF